MGPLGSKSQERILSANSEKEKKGGEEGLGHPGELAFEWGWGEEGRKTGQGDPTQPATQPQKVWMDNRVPRAKSLWKEPTLSGNGPGLAPGCARQWLGAACG